MQQRYPWLLTLVFMTFVSGTFAQKRSPINYKKQLDDTFAAISQVNVANTSDIRKIADLHLLADVVDQGISLLDAENERMKQELAARKPAFSGGSATLGRQFLQLISDMPEPVINLPLAKKTMKTNVGEDIYSLYIKKVEAYQEQLQEEIRKNAPSFTEIPNAYKAKQDLENNPMIQQMGGLEKLQNMSPAERQALARQMAEKMEQNPSAYNGQESDPKKAFTQKMMKDPDYAAKFNHMTVPQQQEEYERFKKENGFTGNELPKNTANADNAGLSITIDQKISTIFNHQQELSNIIRPLQERTETYFAEVNKQLSEQLDERVKALPLAEHGEAGKSKETRPLDIAYNIVLYPIKVQEALANKNIWASRLSALKVTIAEYDEFLAAYWRKDKTTDQLMAQRNQTPPAILAGICNEVIQLTKMARYYTHTNASAQRSYDERVLRLYE